MLDLAEIEAGRLELDSVQFQLDDVLASIAELLGSKAREKGLELSITCGDDVPRALEGDPVRLEQVLVHLVGNAIKFTDRGEVRVTTELLRTLHERVVLLTVETAATPLVRTRDRLTIRAHGSGLFEVVVRFGFMESPEVPKALQLAVDRELLPQLGPTSYYLGRETGLWVDTWLTASLTRSQTLDLRALELVDTLSFPIIDTSTLGLPPWLTPVLYWQGASASS